MHILEQYAVNCGAKISKPFILKEFFPIPFEKYIVLHAGSGMDSKNYDYFDTVVQYIKPFLDSKNIHIVQIGGPQEKLIRNCYNALGTSKRQMAYIIDNSLLYFGNDTMSLHFASFFQKKIVCTSTVLYKSCFYPYWSKDEDYQIIESHRNGKKPTFSAQENPKTINLIKPEELAGPVLKYLEFENFKLPKTIFIGERYNSILMESIPSVVLPPHIFPNLLLNIRYDYIDNIKNDDYLATLQNLTIRNCSLITDKILDIERLLQFKEKITSIIYDITFNDIDQEFFAKCKAYGFNMITIFNKIKNKKEEDLNNKKLQLIEYQDQINIIDNIIPKIDLVKSAKFYKSKKILFTNNNTFLSKTAYLENKPVHIKEDLNLIQSLEDIKNIEMLVEEDAPYLLFYK